jgi:O-antigen/teichoic acid export membrane protein
VAWYAGLGVAAQAAEIVVMVVALPLLVRSLGADKYGVLNLVLVIVSYLMLLNCGLAQALTKLSAEALGRRALHEVPMYFWIANAAVGVIGLGGAAALAAAAPFLAGRVFSIPPGLAREAISALQVAALAVPTAVITLNLTGVLEAHQHFALVNALRAPWNVLNTLLPLAGALAGAGMATMIWLIVAKNALFALVLFALCWRLVPVLRAGFRWEGEVARRLFVFAGWTALLSPTVLVLSTLDRLLTGALLGMKALTYYAVPQQITNTLGALARAGTPVLYPTFSRLFESDRERLSALHREAVACIALGMALVGFVVAVCGREILTLWMGSDFAQSATVLQILCLGAFFGSLHQITSTLLQGTRYVRWVVAITYLIFAAEGTLLWALMARGGVVGAAWASVLTQLLALVLLMGTAVRVGLVDRGGLVSARLVATCAALLVLGLIGLKLKEALAPPPWLVFSSAAAVAAAGAWLAWRQVLDVSTRTSLTRALARVRGGLLAPGAESA